VILSKRKATFVGPLIGVMIMTPAFSAEVLLWPALIGCTMIGRMTRMHGKR
jgi:hypothetical protein